VTLALHLHLALQQLRGERGGEPFLVRGGGSGRVPPPPVVVERSFPKKSLLTKERSRNLTQPRSVEDFPSLEMSSRAHFQEVSSSTNFLSEEKAAMVCGLISPTDCY